MAIQDFIKKVCVQTAIYWQPKGVDGFGKQSFHPAVDIACRWDEVSEKIVDKHNVEVISTAQVLVTQDLDVNGFIKLGSISDLEDINETPRNIAEVYEIKKIEKTPEFRSKDKFVITLYLGK